MLVCSKDTPRWVYKLFRRWHRLLNMQEWTVRVIMSDAPMSRSRSGAYHPLSCQSYPEYKCLDVYVARWWTNAPDAWEAVAHELRHAIIDGFYSILVYAMDRRRKVDKKLILRQWNELTEAAIQNEIAVFRNLDRTLH